jgi:hypothetical protein
MNKIFTTLTIFFLFAISVSAQTVSQTHMAFLTQKTATWCGPCGDWAWPVQEEIVAQNMAKAVVVELHYSSSDYIYNTTAGAIQSNFPTVSSVPAWFANGVNKTSYSASGGIYTGATKTGMKTVADSTYNVPADVQCAYNFSLSGSTLTVNTNTKFFNTVNGEYYLAVYVIENNVMANQTGHIPLMASHQNVLRTSMSTSAFGEQVGIGSIAANTVVPKTFTTTLNASWNTWNVWIAAVIWKKNGTTYDYVNSYTNMAIVGIEEAAAQGVSFSVFPNPVSSDATVSVMLEKNIDDCQITMMDITGRQVKSIHTGNLHQGLQHFPIDTRNLAEGIYTVNVIANGTVASRKIIITR